MRALSLRFGGVLTGLLLTLLLPAASAGGDQPPSPARDRVDLYGDPLPEGVLARLGTARFRHGNGASVAFLPDGKTILTFGADRTFRYWDLATGRQVREQRQPKEGYLTFGAVLTHDGGLAAYSEDNITLTLWDTSRHEARHQLPLNVRFSKQLAFSPDGKTVVVADYNGVLKTFDVSTGQERLLGKLKRAISTMFFAADGTLVTECPGGELHLWDLARGQVRSQLTLPENCYLAGVSPDSRILAIRKFVPPDTYGLEFWDATGKPAAGWTAPPPQETRGVQFTPDGKTVLIVTRNSVMVWDPFAGKTLHAYPAVQASRIVFSPDGKKAAAFGLHWGHEPYGATLFVFDLTNGASHPANAPERGHLYEVQTVAFAPDGRLVATACKEDSSVRLWQAETSRLVRSFSIPELVFRALTFTADGKHLLLGTRSAILRWNLATGKEVGRYLYSEADKPEELNLSFMQLTDDGKTLLAVVNTGFKTRQYRLLAWDVTSGKLRSIPLSAALSPYSYYSHFSPDGRLLALVGGGIHDTTTGAKLLHFAVMGSTPRTPVVFSRDGTLLAAGPVPIIRRLNGQEVKTTGIQVWELATALPVVQLETGEVPHAAFTPDGRAFITADRDGLTRWDLVTGRAVVRKPAHAPLYGSYGPSFASSFALAADGRTAVTGHTDTTALIWDLAPPPTPPAAPLTAEQQEAAWADLAGADAGRAFAALARLADVPEQTTPWLRERLTPAKAPPVEELRQLITDLDASQFNRREKATARLLELGEEAHAVLRDTLKGRLSIEARRRIESLMAEPRVVRLPEVRRHLRVVRLLEMIGNAEARRLLEKLVSGAPEARPTREAKAALGRLERRR